mgnify:CR=1 FL=1
MGKPINIEVYVRKGESVERAIKRFNKKVKKLGIIDEVIKKKRYEKPSVARRRKKLQRLRLIEKQNQLRREEEQNLYKGKPKRKNKRSNR